MILDFSKACFRASPLSPPPPPHQLTHLHPQPCQLQVKGFSPVCLLRWAFRWLLLVYILLQPAKVHLCILIRSATGFLGNF